MKSYLIFCAAAAMLALNACQPKLLPEADLAAYTFDPAHSLHQVRQSKEIEVSVTYQPVDLLISREFNETTPSAATVDSLRAKYAGSAYFLLSLTRHHEELLQPGPDFAAYSDLLQTLAFHMGDYVQLITSQGDTLRPSNYYLDRTYAKATSSQLLFVFPTKPTTGEWQLYLAECGLGTGNLRFSFDCQQLRDVPQLAIN